MQKIPLLLTRPEGTNARFLDSLPPELAARLEPVEAPLLRIRPVPAEIEIPPEAEVIFTSASGVLHAPPGNGRRAHCVGARTTQAARAAGWQAECAGQNARELIRTLLARSSQAPLLHLSGTHVRGGVVEALTGAGGDARRIVIYDQDLVPLNPAVRSLLAAGGPVLVPLLSPRAAAHFRRECPTGAKVTLVALSDAVAEAATGLDGARIVTASEPHAAALVACLEKLLGDGRLG